MSEHELSEEEVARHWNDNAASWAREVFCTMRAEKPG
jgi:hypothetical protein